MWGQGIPYLVDTVNNQGADDNFWHEYGADSYITSAVGIGEHRFAHEIGLC